MPGNLTLGSQEGFPLEEPGRLLQPSLEQRMTDCGLSSSVTPAAAAPGRGSASTPPAPPSPPQPMESTATELEDHCPICLDSGEGASYVLPCLHQFCYPCITQWADSKPECPLCRRRVTSIVHSVRADDDFEERVLPPPAAAPSVIRRTAGAPAHAAVQGLRGPAAPQTPAAGHLRMEPLGGFHVYVWAFIFRAHPAVLDPLLPWLQRQLGQLVEDAQAVPAAPAAQSRVISSLRMFGLDEEALIQVLQPSLGRRTRSFVHQLIDTVVRQCSEEARHRMGLGNARAAGGWEGIPEAAPGSSASRGGSPAPRPELRGGPGSSRSARVGTRGEQAERQEDAQEPVPGSSTPSRSSQSCPGRPRRALKRRAGSPEDPSQPPRKPPRRR